MSLSAILVIEDPLFGDQKLHCNSQMILIVSLMYIAQKRKKGCRRDDYSYIPSKYLRRSLFRPSLFRWCVFRLCAFRRSVFSIMFVSARVSAMSSFGNLLFGDEPCKLLLNYPNDNIIQRVFFPISINYFVVDNVFLKRSAF